LNRKKKKIKGIKDFFELNNYLQEKEMEIINMRNHSLNELIETENNYVDDLANFLNIFDTGLQPFISSEDRYLIFSPFSIFHTTHAKFLEALQQEKNNPVHLQKIGKAFKNLIFDDGLVTYYYFFEHYDEAREKLEKLRKENVNVEKVLNEITNQYTFKLRTTEIAGFLAKPFQRIMKYPLLLMELLRRTGFSHIDYDDLLESICKLQIILNDVNAMAHQKKMKLNF